MILNLKRLMMDKIAYWQHWQFIYYLKNHKMSDTYKGLLVLIFGGGSTTLIAASKIKEEIAVLVGIFTILALTVNIINGTLKWFKKKDGTKDKK